MIILYLREYNYTALIFYVYARISAYCLIAVCKRQFDSYSYAAQKYFPPLNIFLTDLNISLGHCWLTDPHHINKVIFFFMCLKHIGIS